MQKNGNNSLLRKTTRGVGRPQRRWVDDIVDVTGRQWIEVAQGKKTWKYTEEAFFQE